jgi:hypothetical protein
MHAHSCVLVVSHIGTSFGGEGRVMSTWGCKRVSYSRFYPHNVPFTSLQVSLPAAGLSIRLQ